MYKIAIIVMMALISQFGYGQVTTGDNTFKQTSPHPLSRSVEVASFA
jgi:hypothetical protein